MLTRTELGEFQIMIFTVQICAYPFYNTEQSAFSLKGKQSKNI